jgi:hypothetical protein
MSDDPIHDIWVIGQIFLHRKDAILDAIQTIRAFTENRGLQRAIATFESIADDLKKAGL